MVATDSILCRKLHLILHRAFVEARILAGRCQIGQLFDLADTFEVIPELMLNRSENDVLDWTRDVITRYREKYPEATFDYLAVLEMDDAEFRTTFLRSGME